MTHFHTSNQFKVTNEKNSFLKNGAGKLDIQTQKCEAGPLTPITHTQKKKPRKEQIAKDGKKLETLCIAGRNIKWRDCRKHKITI